MSRGDNNGRTAPETGTPPGAPNESGRDRLGRFAEGNKHGTGSFPFSRQIHDWRRAFASAVTPEDVRAVALRLVQDARGGNARARRELLDRCCGKPGELSAQERAEQLSALADLMRQGPLA